MTVGPDHPPPHLPVILLSFYRCTLYKEFNIKTEYCMTEVPGKLFDFKAKFLVASNIPPPLPTITITDLLWQAFYILFNTAYLFAI